MKVMTIAEMKIHRLTLNQLYALKEIARAPKGIISSTQSADRIGVTGKSLGGVFSSLSRQTVRKEPLIIPWGMTENSRGLRWKLNEKVISRNELLEVINRLLE